VDTRPVFQLGSGAAENGQDDQQADTRKAGQMKTIFILFDSLNRSALSCYGGSIPTPNFDRLAEKSALFDNHYIGSMPCMPARRDMHTGRLNFLHRSWGPLEPFDDSFVVALRKAGIYTHLSSDHNHYFEDGGATYHTRYNSFDFIRGQESDTWVAMVKSPLERFREIYHPLQIGGKKPTAKRMQGLKNMTRFKADKDFPIYQCFDAALDFLENNGTEDGWMLQLECFDPHEPFIAPESFREAFPTAYEGPIYTWPQYRSSAGDTPDEIAEIRANYGALVAFCDQQMGRLLDYLDAHNAWEDTAIVLTTDHGFLLGEHDWWGKQRMPFFNEIAHIPMMIHLPDYPDSWGQRIDALTQAIDLSPTLLDIFGLEPCEDTLGSSMLPLITKEASSIRDLAIFGTFGAAINATDGRYTYFLYPEDMESKPLYEYTLMPTHQVQMFEVRELVDAELVRGFNFTKGVPVLKIPALADAARPPLQGGGFAETRTCLFDLKSDPFQMKPFRQAEIEQQFIDKIRAEARRHDAPAELLDRFGLAGEAGL
jgi:arylsulfatase A-like enzyme